MARRKINTVWRKIAALAMAVAVSSAFINQTYADTYTDATTGVTWTYSIISDTNVQLGNGTDPCIDKSTVVYTSNIPWTFEDNGTTYTVTKVADKAFAECAGLTGPLSIPSTVTSLGSQAFFSCTGLTGITSFGGIKNSISGQQLFRSCSGLTSLVVPDTFSAGFGNFAFDDCDSLISVIVGSDTTQIPRYFASRSSSLKGVWVKGFKTTSSGSQPRTKVFQPYTFSESSALKVVLFGEHTYYDVNSGGNIAMFKDVTGCTVFVPNNGKWTDCYYGGTSTKVITYGANTNLDITVDEAGNTITFTPTDEEAFKNAVAAAPLFYDAFGWKTMINMKNTINLSAGVITAEMLEGIRFNTMLAMFSVTNQAQLEGVLSAFADTTTLIAIDPTGLTETLTVPAGRNVYVKLSEGLQVKKHVDGFIIIFK